LKLKQALLEQKEGTPEASIEYFRKAQYGYDKEGKGALAVKISQFSLLKIRTVKLKDFWDEKKESKLVEQFVKATFNLGKKYKIIDNHKIDFETYQYIVENLFSAKKPQSDIIFDMEPGYDFKGFSEKEKFSISKIRHDESEVERGNWHTRKELKKLK
jgi:hypothetical protein